MSCSASYGQTMPNHYINSDLHTMSTILEFENFITTKGIV